MRALTLVILLLLVAVPGCASSRQARVESALLADMPPADFTLAVTVMRPVPLGALINARTEPPRSGALRPARYVVEADAVLRAAIGYGATEQTFPPRTRQLSAAQLADLWNALRSSALVDPNHSDLVGKLPDLESFSRDTEGRGGYCVSFSIAGDRRVLAIDEADPAAADARALVERLNRLAWVQPPTTTDDPTEPTP